MFRACGSRRRVDYEGTGWCPGKGRPSVQCRDGRVVVRWRVGRGTCAPPSASLVLARGGVCVCVSVTCSDATPLLIIDIHEDWLTAKYYSKPRSL